MISIRHKPICTLLLMILPLTEASGASEQTWDRIKVAAFGALAFGLYHRTTLSQVTLDASDNLQYWYDYGQWKKRQEKIHQRFTLEHEQGTRPFKRTHCKTSSRYLVQDLYEEIGNRCGEDTFTNIMSYVGGMYHKERQADDKLVPKWGKWWTSEPKDYPERPRGGIDFKKVYEVNDHIFHLREIGERDPEDVTFASGWGKHIPTTKNYKYENKYEYGSNYLFVRTKDHLIDLYQQGKISHPEHLYNRPYTVGPRRGDVPHWDWKSGISPADDRWYAFLQWRKLFFEQYLHYPDAFPAVHAKKDYQLKRSRKVTEKNDIEKDRYDWGICSDKFAQSICDTRSNYLQKQSDHWAEYWKDGQLAKVRNDLELWIDKEIKIRDTKTERLPIDSKELGASSFLYPGQGNIEGEYCDSNAIRRKKRLELAREYLSIHHPDLLDVFEDFHIKQLHWLAEKLNPAMIQAGYEWPLLSNKMLEKVFLVNYEPF